MNRRIFRSSNNTNIYLIALVVIVIAFFLLGGVNWLKGATHGGSAGLGTLQWGQIPNCPGYRFCTRTSFLAKENLVSNSYLLHCNPSISGAIEFVRWLSGKNTGCVL